MPRSLETEPMVRQLLIYLLYTHSHLTVCACIVKHSLPQDSALCFCDELLFCVSEWS